MATKASSKGADTSAGQAGNKSVAKLPPEAARGNIKALLLANPNYFGNLKDSAFDPVLDISGDTTYEELGCVGFSPALSRLEAVISIKQNSGYDGGLCSAGSQEYVRFYLSTDGGTTWTDEGVVSVNVHDITGPKPLEYSLTQPINVSEDFCFVENLPQVRAILSWNNAPPANTPGFVPVWGNVVQVTIQIPPASLFILGDVLAKAKVQLPASIVKSVDLKQTVAAAPKAALSPAELAAAYQGKNVPASRYLYPEISKVAANPPLAATVNSTPEAPAQHPLALLNVNLGNIVGEILATSGNTDYEELGCVGLDPNRSALVGVLTVKLPYGFNGGLCTAGSTEYVAFWVDWGSGYQYQGTATLNTHDISGIPAGGLEYAVVLPVDIASHMQPCGNGPVTANVRAILSWQTAPPPSDPNYVPVWGNQADALVQIPAGQPVLPGTGNIAIIGGIGVPYIDTTGLTANPGMTLPGATFAFGGANADQWDNTRQCAFGGQVIIQGAPSVGFKYRVWVQKVGSPLPTALTDPISTTNSLGFATTQSPDSNGFFTYLPLTSNLDSTLAYWYSSGDDLWNVWLELANMSDTVLSTTPQYLTQLDNTAPVAEIHIDSGGDCKTFGSGPDIDGHFVATDLHFGYFDMETLSSGNPPAPAAGTTETAPSPGDPWTLSTMGMQPCGYVILLQVWDNTIVDSQPLTHNGDSASVGFCLVAGS
jgi:hypothetical protein